MAFEAPGCFGSTDPEPAASLAYPVNLRRPGCPGEVNCWPFLRLYIEGTEISLPAAAATVGSPLLVLTKAFLTHERKSSTVEFRSKSTTSMKTFVPDFTTEPTPASFSERAFLRVSVAATTSPPLVRLIPVNNRGLRLRVVWT